MILDNNKKDNNGFAILYAVLVASVVAIGGLILSNIIFKQLILSGVGQSSQIAYYAADVGRACARYWNKQGSFGFVEDSYNEITGQSQGSVFTKSDSDIEIMCLDDTSVISPNDLAPGDTENGNWEFTIQDINDNSCAKVTVSNNIDGFESDSVGYNNADCESNNRLVLRRVQDLKPTIR
ncbi:MAG: hypothetical protein K8Q91_02875 [Candidatus Vogelbacteria bacterium]|nr:hypothetical protein [Candidatus Vogelbacteria bacterium]